MAFGETFLTMPELFPARIAGDPLGERVATLDLVGGPYTFLGLDDDFLELLLTRYPAICREGVAVSPAVRTDVYAVAQDEFLEVGHRDWEYTLDLSPAADRVRVAGLDLMVLLELRPTLEGGLWTSRRSGDEAAGVFENYLRVLVAYRILALGGLMLHSAAVVSDGDAHVFYGRSSAGKTTVSRLSLEVGKRVLSDDLNALVPTPSGYAVHKLPFAGELGRTESAPHPYPLRGLYRLRKRRAHVLEDLSPAEAQASLTVTAPYVNIDRDREEQFGAVLGRLSAAVPVADLGFTPDPGFWTLLERRSADA